ncbi:MAG: carbohydrate porin [Candidatus Gastranaerophilales bacterium]|nr:carbohydrate porin [Candidatus Gastranaerophilales bacterium]
MRYKFGLFFIFLYFLHFSAFAIDESVITLDESAEAPKIEKIKGYIEESPCLVNPKYRTKLEDRGIDIQSSYMTNSFVMRNRESHTTKGTYQGLYNLSVDLDSEKLNLYKGGKLHILYQVGNKGRNSMEFLNTYSDMSSYDPMKSINQISELYYEQSFKDDILNLKIGKQDANADFQALGTGFEFLNLSFSFIDNTPMPLFPSQQTGIRARIKLPKEIYIQNGFYDGNLKIGAGPKSFFTGENDYLNMTEIYKLTDFKGKEGKYLIGDWIKTSDKTNYGFYAGFEQKLTDRFEDKSGGLSAFGQFGYARNSINDVPYYAGGGFVFKGITKKRKDDSVGIAFGWHQFNKILHKTEHATAEKVIELFYKIKLTEFLYIQPDIQYIMKPSGSEKDAFAFGLRTCITF